MSIVLKFNDVVADVEAELDCDLHNHPEVDFWKWWISEIDNEIVNHKSGKPICIVELMSQWQASVDINNDHEVSPENIELERILAAFVEVMGQDAHEDVVFEYEWE